MKTIAALVAGCFLFPTCASAFILTIALTASNEHVAISLSSMPVSQSELHTVLRRVAASDTNLIVYVSVDSTVPVTALASVIHELQQLGLHDVVLIAPAEVKGQRGHLQLSLDCTMRKIPADIRGEFLDSGFVADPGGENSHAKTPDTRPVHLGDFGPATNSAVAFPRTIKSGN